MSRGGVKLAAALDHFGIDPGRVCLDVGASTGGFTDVLLARGARRVYAVDVGHGQLHESLRARPRRRVARGDRHPHAAPAPDSPSRPDLIAIDVSFISLKLVLPAALALARRRAQLVALIKPQFEAGRGQRQEGHRARPGRARGGLPAIIGASSRRSAGASPASSRSPIAGGDGNREFLIGAAT